MVLEGYRGDDVAHQGILILDGQLFSGANRPGSPDSHVTVALGHVVAAVCQAAVVQQGEQGAEAVAGSLALRLVQGQSVGACDGQ